MRGGSGGCNSIGCSSCGRGSVGLREGGDEDVEVLEEEDGVGVESEWCGKDVSCRVVVLEVVGGEVVGRCVV